MGSISETKISVPSIAALESKLKHYGVDIQRLKAAGSAVILLDCSGSMAGEKLIQSKIGTKEFMLQAKKKRYQIGLITFSSKARVLSEITSDYYKVMDQLDGLAAYGSTNLSHALRLSYDLFGKSVLNKLLVIVTDGRPNNEEDSLYVARKLKDAGIGIFTIGTDDADINFLRKISSGSGYGISVQKQYLADAISSAAKYLIRD